MSKKSLRVYLVVHETGLRTGTLMRTWDELFDRPPPAACGRSNEEVYAELETQLHRLEIQEPGGLERYLWEEHFETRQVRVDVHPLSSIKKRLVIGAKEIPLVLTYAACPLKGGGFRVMVPRFGGWFVLEDLSLAADVLRHAVSSWLLGDDPKNVYDFRHVGSEHVVEWAPALLMRAREAKPASVADEFPELSKVADDLVERAANGKLAPVVGDIPRLDGLAAKLTQSPPPSLLLVGPPGVGKTAFVRRLAAQCVAARRGKAKGPARLWSTTRDRVIAGMIYLGMWQERCLTLVRELSFEGDYLHFDRLAGILEPQSDGASIADFLEPAMESDALSIIAECTPSELERAQRSRPSLVGRMTLVRVDEPSPQATIELLLAYAKKKGKVDVHPSGLKRLLRHAAALERGVAFPGKGIRFLDWLAQESAGKSAAAATGAKDARPDAPRAYYPRDVSEAYSRYSGVPLTLLSDDVAAGAPALAALLAARVVGQDAACEACGRLLARFKANLVDPERPSGTLLFVGPTGVGKTELAKQIARTTFGSDLRMIRLDMSEYRLPGSAMRLLDASPGTRSLATRVREQPLSLVLFDEIEKAHAEVFDLLLGVLGEGRMLDTSGRSVDFRGAILVMTSNLGVRDTRAAGFGEASHDDHLRAVRGHFRPELFNRIDYVLSFRPLDVGDVERIVELEIASAQTRMGLQRRGVRLELTARARRRLAELGHEPTRGARPLKRLLEERVLTPIARRIAEDPRFKDQLVLVAAEGDEPASSAPKGGLHLRV